MAFEWVIHRLHLRQVKGIKIESPAYFHTEHFSVSASSVKQLLLLPHRDGRTKNRLYVQVVLKYSNQMQQPRILHLATFEK